jgi:glutamyl-tRNA reductase
VRGLLPFPGVGALTCLRAARHDGVHRGGLAGRGGEEVSVVVVGLHERDASLDLLGRLAVGDGEAGKVLASLCDSPHLSEAVVLSTCNRTEVYAVLERFHDGLEDIQAFFFDRLGGSPEAAADLAGRLVVAYDDAAARHLFEVAAGVDSVILGEGEILRQVRRAAELARRERASGPVLNGLFRHAVSVGKRVRSETAIARGTTSLAYLAVEIARERCGGSLEDRRVLQVGVGEVGTGVVEALADVPGVAVAVANRSLRRAEHLARRFEGRAVALEALGDELEKADVVVTATSALEPVITEELASAAIARRGQRPLVVIDAAVPRDVEPSVADLPGVELFDLDALNSLALAQVASRRGQIPRVLEIVDEELERYREAVRSRSVAPLISALRSRAEAIRAAELERLDGSISQSEATLVDEITRRVVAKLLHEPTVRLKLAAGSAKGERLAEALRTLYDL